MMRYERCVRTTVSLDSDVVAAVQAVRAEKGLGLSEAVNELIPEWPGDPEATHPVRATELPHGVADRREQCRRRTGDP